MTITLYILLTISALTGLPVARVAWQSLKEKGLV